MAEAVPGAKGRRIREALTGSRNGYSSAVERQIVDASVSFGRQRTFKFLETRLVGFLCRRVLLGLDVIRERWAVRSLSHAVGGELVIHAANPLEIQEASEFDNRLYEGALGSR